MFVGAVLRFFRLWLPVLVAFCVSTWLLGCGATPAHTQDWAQTTRSGQRVFRLCRRHPHVAPDARYWYDLGDRTLRTTRKPLEELLESRAVKVLFIYDPHAPPESRRLLGLAYQDLPCDNPPPPKPPPPEKIAAKEREDERKKDEQPKPKPKPIARSPERCPEPGQARRRGSTGARTCARTLVHTSERSRQASFPIARAPERCPEPGQARRRGDTGARTCARTLVHTSERSRQASFRRAEAPPAPRPVPPPAPKDPSEVNPGEVWQYETWSQTPEETALLERAQECLTGACHARHKNFQPKGGTKPAGRHNGPSLSTGSGSGGGASAPKHAVQPAPKPAAPPAPAPRPKTTVKTTTKPVAKPNGAAAGQAGSGSAADPPPQAKPKRGGENPAAARGREVHKEFKKKVKEKKGEGWRAEERIDVEGGTYIRPDAVTPKGNPIELKPNTPSGRDAGKRQIKKYEEVLKKKGRVIYYDP
ncbi:hypothetical protein [Polyangium fumosum]|nr:hypothetical protein [Polyangium fumosum]